MSKEQIDELIKTKSAVTVEILVNYLNATLEKNGGDFIDAIVTFCERNDVEIETVASVIKSNSKLKAKLKASAQSLNLLAKEKTEGVF